MALRSCERRWSDPSDEKGRVCGVRVKDHDIACRTVVSAVGIHLTLQSLLPCPAPSLLKYAKLAALQHKLEQSGLERTRGHVSLFVTLNGSADVLRLPRHNSWIFPGYDLGAQARKLEALNPSTLDAAALKALDAPWMYLALAFPSAKDPAWGGADSHLKDVSTAVVIAEVPTEWWDVWASTRVHARGAAYDDLKLALEAKMLAVLLRRFPQCEGRVRSVSSGTPLSTKQYLHKANGESYGLKPTPALSKCQDDWLQPGLGGAVDGLFLAGQDVNLDGFAGATLGGIMQRLWSMVWACGWMSSAELSASRMRMSSSTAAPISATHIATYGSLVLTRREQREIPRRARMAAATRTMVRESTTAA